MRLDEAYKDKIGQQLALRFARAIKEKEITLVEAPYLSRYILENFKPVQTYPQLIKFSEKLVWEWPFFEQVLKLAKEREIKVKESKELEKVRRMLKGGVDG